MPPIRVQVVGHGLVEFPEGTSQADMQAALAHLSGPETKPRGPTTADMLTRDVIRGPNSDAPQGEPGLLQRLNEMMGPSAHPQSMSDMLPLLIPAGTEVAIGALKEYLNTAREAYAKATTLKGIPKAFVDTLWKNAFGELSPERAIPGFDRYAPNVGGAEAAAQTLERPVAAATSPAESVSGGTPLPSGPPPESAPAGSQSAPAPALPKVKVPASQMKEYIALRQRGMTHEQAVNAIQAALAFQQRFGTPTPTAQETRFPKGMRGKASGAAGMHGEGEPE